jgi:hypothetical protein
VVEEQLGHSNLSMTQRYTKMLAELAEAAARPMEVPPEVARLLGDPGCSRLPGAASQEDSARSQLDEEQRIQLLQPDGVDGEEVG